MDDDCPFCDYIGPSKIIFDWGHTFAIEPMNPVLPGHLLVIPRQHVEAFGHSTKIDKEVMMVASHIARSEYGDFNLITSSGKAATQTVRHLHVHLVPRFEGDGLMLPWST